MPSSKNMKKKVKPAPKKFTKRVPAKSVTTKKTPAKKTPMAREEPPTEPAEPYVDEHGTIIVYGDDELHEFNPKNLVGWFFCWLKPLRNYHPNEPSLRYLKNGRAYYARPTASLPEHWVNAGVVEQYEDFLPVSFPTR